MKIKDGFCLREMGGYFIVVPVGERNLSFHKMITLNETGAFLWKQLEQETTIEALVDALTTEYAVDAETALSDIEELTAAMAKAELLA